MEKAELQQLRSETAGRPRSGLELGLNRAAPGLDFVAGEGLLVTFELLGAATEAARSSCLTIP